MTDISQIGGVILAGGKASRMGYRDKALLHLHGKTIIQHVIDRAKPQVSSLLISVNRNPQRYKELNLPLVADVTNSYEGPLVGIYSAMCWFQKPMNNQDMKYLACFAGDVPEFPIDFVKLLTTHLDRGSVKIAYCSIQDHIQPLFSVWNMQLIPEIKAAIDRGIFGPKLLFGDIENVQVDIRSSRPGSFLNINSIADLHQAERTILEK